MIDNKKNALPIAALLLAPCLASAATGPFTDEEIDAKFRAVMFGINKAYNVEPVERRPEGCVNFELRIIRDGLVSWMRPKGGDFDDHALFKRIEDAVINRFDMPGNRLQEPQFVEHTLCFSRTAGVTSQDKTPPPPPPKKTEELMDLEKDGVSNRAWLEQLMSTEGQPPSEGDANAVKSLPQGQVLAP